MLKTNLATRPFYNVTAVRLLLAAVALVVVGATIFNVVQWVRHSQVDADLAARSAADESRSADLRRDARRLRTSVDQAQLQAISTDVSRANDLIDRRTFSWTELFNRFEVTIPADVRITSVRQRVDRERGSILTVAVAGREIEDINQFMRNLEDSGVFRDLLAHDEALNERGEVEAILEAQYTPDGVSGGDRVAERGSPMTPLVRRIVREQRPLVLVLGSGLLLNVLAFVAVVYPRGIKAEGVADRAAAAVRDRQAAERERAAAQALVTGRARADEDLNAFFSKVLPAGRQEARRMMDQTLPALADETGVQWIKRTSEIAASDDSRLMQLTISMVLQGEYDDLRDFIHAVENADQFIVVDDVALSEARTDEPLILSVRLSTYFRATHGA